MVVTAAVLAVIGHVAFMLHHPLPMRLAMTPGRLIFTESALVFSVLIATVAMGRIEHRSWLDYGWRGPGRAGLFGHGVLAGCVLMALLMGALVVTHGARIHYDGGNGSLLASGAAWVLGFALVALTEETVFRGYLFFLLAKRGGPRFAAITMSLAFGIAHLGNHGENVAGILQVIAFSLVMCLSVWRTGSLWWAWGFHAAWDWSESFLFGAADSGNVMEGHLLTTYSVGPTWLSGGSAGPEGSLIALPLLALMAVWITSVVSKKPRARVRDAATYRDMPAQDQAGLNG
ncbi:CAAX amino protease [Dyella mobilis]|nr:CAAX amino protease [Dyella mobilis]